MSVSRVIASNFRWMILVSLFVYTFVYTNLYLDERRDGRSSLTVSDSLAEKLRLAFTSYRSTNVMTTNGQTTVDKDKMRKCSKVLSYPPRRRKRLKVPLLLVKECQQLERAEKNRLREERLAKVAELRTLEYTAMSNEQKSKLVVFPDDEFYTNRYYAPVIVEQFKLVFLPIPKVACTQWLQLFRRMTGASDWTLRNHKLPYTPDTNGLTYLTHYNLTQANRIMTSPEWTRAVFVRDSKERFLSAYLDKVVHTKHIFVRSCCYETKDCVSNETTFADFYDMTETCNNEHWEAQSDRFPERVWQTINFVGHMDTLQEDARRLLGQVGAWDEYASAGWGPNGTHAMFAESVGQSTASQHATGAQDRLRLYYTPQLELAVERRFAEDYEHPVFKLPKRQIFEKVKGKS